MQTNLYIITNLQPQNENKKSLSDFKNNIFCNPIGYAFEPVIKELVDKKEMQIKIVTEFDELTCLKAVIAGKADFMTVNTEYLRHLKKEHPTLVTMFKKIMPEISQNYLRVIFSKTVDPKFVAEFNKQSHEFMTKDEYKNIIKDYE